MADNEKLQAELQVLRAENAQLKDELQKLTATQSEKSVFQTLNEYDISEHLKKKDKIIYLPWSKAWMILKTLYPDSQVEVIENAGFDSDDVVRYFTDGKTAWVSNASSSHTTYSGWSYGSEKITKSGGTASLTGTLSHLLHRNIPVNISLTCSPTGQIS